ncbi:MAG: hypothetical protein GF384_04660 [Elusimicrobia bacterium]|nr:hypothetical protein [Elusimicrobiota bacterium]
MTVMRWKKLGKIFDPVGAGLDRSFIGFAQAPSAVVFDDFVRIYFSTRKRSDNGKHISWIKYAEFDKSFGSILNISQHTVIELGERGTFDEHGIFPINIVQYKGKMIAYTGGWSRRISVSVETGIGIAFSENSGKTFKKNWDGPVLSSSLREPFLIGDPCVKLINDTFHLFYIYGTDWRIFDTVNVPERVYKIGHAVSDDGINWTKQGVQLIQDKFDYESQAMPTVIKIGDIYHMWFCYRKSFDFRKNSRNAYKIGYAYSSDLKDWIRDDNATGIEVSKGGWDSDMVCYPHVFNCDGKIYMLYNGNEFGKNGFGIAELVSCSTM